MLASRRFYWVLGRKRDQASAGSRAMRATSILLAVSLLATSVALLPGAEAAREPVGDCGSGAIVQFCPIPCLVPPCPVMVCIHQEPIMRCR